MPLPCTVRLVRRAPPGGCCGGVSCQQASGIEKGLGAHREMRLASLPLTAGPLRERARHRGDGAGLEVRGSALPLRRVGRPTCKVRGFKRVAFAGLGAPDLVVPSSPLSRAPLRAQEPGRHHLSLRVLVLCLANVLVAPKWSDTGAKGSGCVCPQESGWTLRGEEPAPEQAQAAPGALAFQFSAGGVGLAAPGLLGRS